MSTYPDGQWMVLSGTSMANPYVAGSAALLLQVRGKSAAKSVRSLLQTTAQIVPSSRSDGALPQTLAWQGSGLINMKAALNSQTTVSPAVVLLNDTAHWSAEHTITITNSGKDSETYSLAHVAAATTVTKPADRPDLSPAPVVMSVPSPFPIPLVFAPVGVKFDRETITIGAGQSGTVKVTVTPPTNADVQTLPVVSGWITATSGSGEVVKVSYLGLSADFGSAQTIDTTAHTNGARDPLPGILPSSELRFQTGPRNYSLAEAFFTVPQYNFAVSVPSTHALLDLVSADTEIQSTVPHKNAKRTWSDWLPSSGARIDAVSDYPTLGPLAVYNYMPRGARFGDKYRIDLTQFANGTQIPLGQYKVLLRALRPFGDPNRAADYDVHVSVQFGWVP